MPYRQISSDYSCTVNHCLYFFSEISLLLKLLKVTKACYSFKNNLERVFFKSVAGHWEKAVVLVCCHYEKAEESLSYLAPEDNQQMPERSWKGFMLADRGRSYLGWQILQKLRTCCAELPPVETCVWCLLRMFGVLRTGRVCVLSMQAAM